MCEARTRALLNSLHTEFDLLQEEHEALNRRNNFLLLEVAQLQAKLDQREFTFSNNCEVSNELQLEQSPVTLDLGKGKAHAHSKSTLQLLEQTSACLDLTIEKVSAPTQHEPGVIQCTISNNCQASHDSTLDQPYASLDSAKGTINSHSKSNVICIDDYVVEDLACAGAQGALKAEISKQLKRKGSNYSASDLLLWPAWEEDAVLQTTHSVRLARSMISQSETVVDVPSRDVKYGDELRSLGFLQCLVTRPSSPRQVLWDLLSVLFMCVDVLMVPMQAFPLPHTGVAVALDWITVVFWTLDIPNNFFTGYHQNGIYEMRPLQIAKRYARKMFLVDLTVVLVDWLVVLQDSNFMQNISFMRILKSYRFARALRLIRVVRIAKMLNLMVQLSDQMAFFTSETMKIVIDISKLFLFIVVASHFLACGWYAIGTTTELGESGVLAPHWVEKFGEDHGGVPSVGYQYVTSLHWALTQFTPASMEVVPRNVVERVYAIMVLCLAVVAFSSFVSSITSSMTRLRMMNMDRAKQRDDISRYILDHGMTLSLGNRINQFLRKRDSMPPPRVHEEDVSLFKCLPEALRVDMHREVFLPVLCLHPFFQYYCDLMDDASLATVCHTAMQERASAKGEYIFNWGEKATSMFFIQSGTCEYSLGVAMHNDVLDVEADMMVSEAVLWVPWEHVGRLLVVKHVELATLDSAVMQGALRGQPAAMIARKYAVEFLRRQVQNKGYTDLCTDKEEASDMAQMAWGVEENLGSVEKSIMTTVTFWDVRVRTSVKSALRSFTKTVTGAK